MVLISTGLILSDHRPLRRATSKSDRSGNWQSDANLFHKPRFILCREWQDAKMASETLYQVTSLLYMLNNIHFLGNFFLSFLIWAKN